MAEEEPVALDAAAITLAPGQEPFTLVPVIDDILRTRYCVAGSVFLVEDIAAVPVSKTGRWRAIRLLVGDGDLCVQALLGSEMHRFVETGEITVGTYVRADDFAVKWRHAAAEEDRNGDKDSDAESAVESQDGDEQRMMVYLVLENVVTIGWNDSYRTAWQQQQEEVEEELASENDLDLEEAGLEYDSKDVDMVQGDGDPTSELPELPGTKYRRDEKADGEDDDDDAAMEDAFEAFEAFTFPPKKPHSSSQTSTSKGKAVVTAPSSIITATTDKTQAIALPRDWHDPQTPLKLTTLRSIPLLPYAQNWSCNILAIVASLSPVETSYLPPYRQRTARLVDPSTAKQVHLTVFLDPEDFAPAVGSAVLLVGVKNHRFDGGSLKKYASDGKMDGEKKRKWWFEDPWELDWCDVAGIKQWWDEVQRSTA